MMTGTKSRLFVLSALAATIVALPATDARADEIAPCDLTVSPYKCAKIAAPSPFVKSLGEDAGFSNDLDTGWFPKCPNPATDPHCDKNIQVRAQANLKDTKVDITLTSDWVVRWGAAEAGLAANSVRIGPRKKQPAGGDLKVKYKLYPNLGLYIGISQFKGEFNFDPFDILKLVKGDKIGIDTDFDYGLSCGSTFSLWSYGAPSEPCTVKDDDKAGGLLFSFDPATLLGNAGKATEDYVKLNVTLKAFSDAKFTWQTNTITLEGNPGTFSPTVDYLDIPYDGSASIVVKSQAKGIIAYKGATGIVPTVNVQEVAGIPVNIDFPVNAGKVDLPFDSKLPETTIQQNFVFPVPNLKATVTPVKFGSLEIDTAAKLPTKQLKVKLANLGDGISKATVSSSNQAIFKIVKKDIETAGTGEGEIEIEFAPTDAGDFMGEITVVSNNIDGIDQKIPVSGSATLKKIDEPPPAGGKGGASGKGGSAGKAEVAGSGGSDPEPTGGSGGKKTTPRADDSTTEDGGCGCRVPTQSPAEQAPAAALALVGLAALAIRRRKLRRNTSPLRSSIEERRRALHGRTGTDSQLSVPVFFRPSRSARGGDCLLLAAPTLQLGDLIFERADGALEVFDFALAGDAHDLLERLLALLGQRRDLSGHGHGAHHRAHDPFVLHELEDAGIAHQLHALLHDRLLQTHRGSPRRRSRRVPEGAPLRSTSPRAAVAWRAWSRPPWSRSQRLAISMSRASARWETRRSRTPDVGRAGARPRTPRSASSNKSRSASRRVIEASKSSRGRGRWGRGCGCSRAVAGASLRLRCSPRLRCAKRSIGRSRSRCWLGR